MLNTLSYIGRKLNESNILWAVGGSILLNQFGLTDKPNDIDILVGIEDIGRADEFLKSIGHRKKCENTGVFSTKYLYQYIINGIDVDVMAGLAINYSEGVFEYIFDHKSISEYMPAKVRAKVEGMLNL